MRRLIYATATISASAVIAAAAFFLICESTKSDPDPKKVDRNAEAAAQVAEAPGDVELDGDAWPDMDAELPPSDVKLPHMFALYEPEASLKFSVSQYKGDLKIHVVEGDFLSYTIKFVRGQDEILVLKGHAYSVSFTVNGGRSFFAHFSSHDMGCRIGCYDLDNGQTVWKTRLRAVGLESHFAYQNRVVMEVSPKTVTVTGAETFGDYIEVLDRQTGRLLAHRVYRMGFD